MTRTADLVIRNGRVLVGEELQDVDIVVRGGVIDGFVLPGTHQPASGTLDADGLVVLPGLVDAHVHFREPGFTQKEDFTTGSCAAAFGGVTTVLDMPTTTPPVYDATTLNAKRDLVTTRSWVDFGLYGALDATNLSHAGELADAGAIALKVFMYERRSAPPYGITNDAVLMGAFQEAADTGLVVAVHAESDELLKDALEQIHASDRLGTTAHLNSHPAIAEAEAVQRAILFADATGAKLHIAHLSSAIGVRMVREARLRGSSVTAEVTPQHLLLDDQMYATLGATMKMVPPIRSQDDQAALWSGLLDGTIEVIATDHAPHTIEEKRQPMLEAASGIIGVETTLPLMLTQVSHGRIDLRSFSQAASEAPARIFGLYPTKGIVAVGSDADLIAVDLARTATLDSRLLHSRQRITPFDGWTLQGGLVYTVVRGQLVVADGRTVGRPMGRMVKPRLG